MDIANAYCSLPNETIMTALKNAHVLDQMCKLVESYYANIKIRFSTKDLTTTGSRWISVLLFAVTMTMLVMPVKNETKGPKSTSG